MVLKSFSEVKSRIPFSCPSPPPLAYVVVISTPTPMKLSVLALCQQFNSNPSVLHSQWKTLLVTVLVWKVALRKVYLVTSQPPDLHPSSVSPVDVEADLQHLNMFLCTETWLSVFFSPSLPVSLRLGFSLHLRLAFSQVESNKLQ